MCKCSVMLSHYWGGVWKAWTSSITQAVQRHKCLVSPFPFTGCCVCLPCPVSWVEERWEPHETLKVVWPTPKCKREKCDGADPTLGGCESGTTTTQSSLSGDIHVLLRFIYCKDFIPKLASYPSNLWDICFVRVICHWIKFLHKPFISYCALVYWGHPRLTCKTTGNAFLAHIVILTRGLKS